MQNHGMLKMYSDFLRKENRRGKIKTILIHFLVFMNDDLENQGMTIKQAYFDFTEELVILFLLPKEHWNKMTSTKLLGYV